MKIDTRYFERFDCEREQVLRNIDNAARDLAIAKRVDILEVKFHYAYSSFLKSGIALLSRYGIRAKSVPGHQIHIIRQAAELLEDPAIEEMGNLMRNKRNLDLYGGGIEITEKECSAFILFAERVLDRVRAISGS
jgi:uncharacterized protein (UPF0332 family)